MPNYCTNKLTVKHADPAKISEFLEAYKTGLCEHFIAQPHFEKSEEMLRSEKEANCVFMTNEAVVWRNKNWGTKWDVDASDKSNRCEVKSDHEVSLEFDSAWAPPMGLYKQLYLLGFEVSVSYWEPGMDFCGRWENFEEQEFDCYTMAMTEGMAEEYNLAKEAEDYRQMMADCEDC